MSSAQAAAASPRSFGRCARASSPISVSSLPPPLSPPIAEATAGFFSDAVDLVDEHPGAPVRHAHRLGRRRDRAGIADRLEQLDLARPDGDRFAGHHAHPKARRRARRDGLRRRRGGAASWTGFVEIALLLATAARPQASDLLQPDSPRDLAARRRSPDAAVHLADRAALSAQCDQATARSGRRDASLDRVGGRGAGDAAVAFLAHMGVRIRSVQARRRRQACIDGQSSARRAGRSGRFARTRRSSDRSARRG